MCIIKYYKAETLATSEVQPYFGCLFLQPGLLQGGKLQPDGQSLVLHPIKLQ